MFEGIEFLIQRIALLLKGLALIVDGSEDKSVLWDINLEMVYHEDGKGGGGRP